MEKNKINRSILELNDKFNILNSEIHNLKLVLSKVNNTTQPIKKYNTNEFKEEQFKEAMRTGSSRCHPSWSQYAVRITNFDDKFGADHEFSLMGRFQFAFLCYMQGIGCDLHPP